MANHILSVEGHRNPPPAFVKQLEAFDSNLRVVWGLSQMQPFPGWIIERRIPDDMKAKVYGGNKPANRERYADQAIVDQLGRSLGRRRFDMMPDWHPIMAVSDAAGDPVMELGEWVIDKLRKNYEHTLLGFPELSRRHWIEDKVEQAMRDEAKKDELAETVGRTAMDHRNEIWPEYFAHGGQPATVKEGTEL